MHIHKYIHVKGCSFLFIYTEGLTHQYNNVVILLITESPLLTIYNKCTPCSKFTLVLLSFCCFCCMSAKRLKKLEEELIYSKIRNQFFSLFIFSSSASLKLEYDNLNTKIPMIKPENSKFIKPTLFQNI